LFHLSGADKKILNAHHVGWLDTPGSLHAICFSVLAWQSGAAPEPKLLLPILDGQDRFTALLHDFVGMRIIKKLVIFYNQWQITGLFHNKYT
jgi:hypothetical protein